MTWFLTLFSSVLGSLKARLVAGGLIAAAIALAALRLFLAGKAAARAEATQDRLKAMRERREIDDDVASLGSADLDKRYSDWLRDKR